jgi:hypothetical protein
MTDCSAQTFILEGWTARVVTWRGQRTWQAESGSEAGLVSFLKRWICLIRQRPEWIIIPYRRRHLTRVGTSTA